MPHKLVDLIQAVDATHSRLGRLVAMGAVVAKAGKCMMVVAPAGTGKSTALKMVGDAVGGAIVIDSVTRSSLGFFQGKLTGYDGLVVVDDVGKIDTAYSRIATITTFAELTYSGFVSKHTITTHVEITGFTGSVMMGIQPVILAQVIGGPEWEANIADKVLRYYHLYRPQEPNRAVPPIFLGETFPLGEVSLGPRIDGLWRRLAIRMTPQWSDARLAEHLGDLLCACAAIDGRDVVNGSDYRVLDDLLKPASIERYLIQKLSLEEGRIFAGDLLAMLVEMASWPNLTIERICRDYRVTPDVVTRILKGMPEWFQVEATGRGKITCAPKLFEILKLAGAR